MHNLHMKIIISNRVIEGSHWREVIEAEGNEIFLVENTPYRKYVYIAQLQGAPLITGIGDFHSVTRIFQQMAAKSLED
jgi:hypothetical protein